MYESVTQPKTAIIWTDEPRLEAARSIAAEAGLRVVAAGCPAAERAAAVAAELDCQPRSDLRATLAQADADVVLICSPGRFGATHDEADAESVRAAASRGTRVHTLEPVPAGPDAATGGAWLKQRDGRRAVDAARRVPSPMMGAGLREGRELLATLGAIRSLAVTSGGPRAHGSAGARLADAAAVLYALVGVPEHVDAASGPIDARSDASVPHRISGAAISLVARYADGRTATLVASDAWAVDELRVDALTEDGRVQMSTNGFVWYSGDGTQRDRHDAPRPASWPARVASEMLRADAASAAPGEPLAVLAIVEAAVLSTRTGQAESPETVLRLLRQ